MATRAEYYNSPGCSEIIALLGLAMTLITWGWDRRDWPDRLAGAIESARDVIEEDPES